VVGRWSVVTVNYGYGSDGGCSVLVEGEKCVLGRTGRQVREMDRWIGG
jgi:hypothetical protein